MDLEGKKVQWVGGPQDGEWLVVKKDATHLTIVVNESFDLAKANENETDPLQEVSYHRVNCEIRGHKIYYPYLKINTPKGNGENR